MQNSLLVPNKKATSIDLVVKGGGVFWDTFWKNFSDVDKFKLRVSNISKSIDKITQKKLPFDENYYIEVKLDDRSRSKSSTPSNLWIESELNVVESPEFGTITVSGTNTELEKLKFIASSATFVGAQIGKGVRKKDQNLFREVYALTGLEDKSLSMNRKDMDILELEKNGFTENVKCIIELYGDIPQSKYENYYKYISKFVPRGSVEKRDLNNLFHNLSYVAFLPIGNINKLLGNCSSIRKIRIYPTFKASRCIPSQDLNNVKLLKPETDEIVGVLDSGIQHEILDIYTTVTEKHTGGKKENHSHGTFVASRIIFGDNIFEQVSIRNELLPCARIADFQFLYDDQGIPTLDYESFKHEIAQIFKKYHDQITIYNFSTNDNTKDPDISELTEYIDYWCRKYDIIFINSAGNQEYYGGLAKSYNEIFSNPGFDNKVKSPGDAFNVLTVGSIALKTKTGSVCTVPGYPSPFTRKGPLHIAWKKPELVAHGGNILLTPGKHINDPDAIIASNNLVGVEGIDSTGLATNCGTSMSAPLVTRQCVFLMSLLKNSNLGSSINTTGNRANLVKAMLVHSTSLTPQVEINDQEIKDAYGFGQADYKKILDSDENEVRIVYSDHLTKKDKIHKLTFKLPESLLNMSLKFIFTGVYNPPVNKNYPSEYNLTQVVPLVKIVKPIFDENDAFIENKYYDISPNRGDWHSYKHRNFNITHFSKVMKNLPSPILAIQNRLYFSNHHSDPDTELQPYSFILSIIDENKHGILRSEIMATNQFNVVVESQVEVTQEAN